MSTLKLKANKSPFKRVKALFLKLFNRLKQKAEEVLIL